MSRKHNKQGKSKGDLGSFIALERYIVNSAAYRALSPIARAAYIELAYGFDGSNNGSLQMSALSLADRLNMSKTSAARSLLELAELGFIEVATGASFTRKLKLAAEYRLTAFKCDKTNALPTKDFMRWTPKLGATSGAHGATSGTTQAQTPSKQPSRCHQWDHKGQSAGVHGATGGIHLYSANLGAETNTAPRGSAANQRAGADPTQHTIETDLEAFTPLRDILDLSKLTPQKIWPLSEAA